MIEHRTHSIILCALALTVAAVSITTLLPTVQAVEYAPTTDLANIGLAAGETKAIKN